MAEEIVELEYRQLARTILEHNPGVDLGRIRAAFEVADLAHSGQRRRRMRAISITAAPVPDVITAILRGKRGRGCFLRLYAGHCIPLFCFFFRFL